MWEGGLGARWIERKLLVQNRGSDLPWWRDQDTGSDLRQTGIQTQLCDPGHLASQPLFCRVR